MKNTVAKEIVVYSMTHVLEKILKGNNVKLKLIALTILFHIMVTSLQPTRP